MADVFVSYVEEDAAIAEKIARALESAGYSTWYYGRDSVPGSSYLLQTAAEIDHARAVVLIISPGSVGSIQVTKEVVRAHESGKPFIPVMCAISHEEFQARQPEWRQALGASVSIPVTVGTLDVALPRIVSGARLLLGGEPSVDDEIAPEPGDLHRVSVLSARVSGAESLKESLAPEEFDALLQECRAAMTRAIEDHGGRPVPSGSDVLGIFGVPEAHEDDAERAALAGLRLIESIESLAEDLKAAWKIEEFAARVGIETGPLSEQDLPGDDGAGSSYGAIAEGAAALREAVAGSFVAVTEETARSLRRKFDLDPLENVDHAFRLLSDEITEKAEDLAPLVDRLTELAVLDESLAELLSGRGQIVLIIGTAGMGKSRLLVEAHRRAEEQGITWLQGRCLSYGEGLTYFPMIEILRGFLGVAEGEAEVAVRLKLRARITSLLGDGAADVLPYLARLLSLKLDAEQAEKVRYLPPDALAEQIHWAYRTWVMSLAADRPAVIALDDLHWADPSTRALAEALLEAAEEAPVAVVAAFRDDPHTEAWRFRLKVMAEYSHRVREMVPARLTESEAAEFAGSFLDPAAFEQKAVGEVLARAEGNPLYVEQLIRSLVDATEMGEGEGIEELPPALESLLVARIDRLPPGAHRLVQLAAIVGRSFVRRVLDRVAEDENLDRNLSILVKAGIIREHKRVPELEYIFTHGLIQDAAASTLADWRRREIHGKVADAFVDLLAAGLDDYLEVIAYQYGQSDDRDKALEFAELAGMRSAGLYANDQAVDLLERARDLAGEVNDLAARRRITEELAEVLARIGSARAIDLYRELAESSPDPDEAARLFALAAWASIDMADDARATQLIEAGLGRAVAPIARARLLQVRARTRFRPFYPDEMRTALEEAESIVESKFPDELAVRQAHLWDLYFSSTGDLDESRRWTTRSLELAQKMDDRILVAIAKHNLAIGLYQAGDILGEKQLMEEVHEQARAMGYARMVVGAATNLTNICYLTGELAQGLRFASEAEPLAVDPYMHSLLLVNWSVIEREVDDVGSARAHLQEALPMAAAAEAEEVHIEATITMCALDVLAGGEGARSAVPVLQDAKERAATLGEQLPLVAAASYWLAESNLGMGDLESAEQEARTGLDGTQGASPDHLVPLRRILGLILGTRRQGAGADELQAALAAARSLGMKLEEGRTLGAMAEVSQGPEADRCRAEARALFEACGGKRDLIALQT